MRRRVAVCVSIRSSGVCNKGAARVGVELFCIRDVLVFTLSYGVRRKGGRCFSAMGCHVKTVLMISFKVFPTDFRWLDFLLLVVTGLFYVGDL